MNKKWTEEELSDTVNAYIDMWYKQQLNIPFIKKSYYKKLHEKHGRSISAFEYRMENISSIFLKLKKPWVKGLKPADHIGEKNTKILEDIVNRYLTEKTLLENFEECVREERKKASPPPTGNAAPKCIDVNTHLFERSPKIKAWILEQANGVCERCSAKAPFIGKDGFPYLEVHHLRPLSNGGSDSIHNTVALCPNCHRELHYGERKDEIKELLYKKIQRLIVE